METCARLARDCQNIVSIKEAGGSAERVSALKKILPPEFTILSGDDGLTLPFMAVGAVGVVSVASNVIPRQITDMVNAFLAGRTAEALKITPSLLAVVQRSFYRIESDSGESRAPT